MSAPREERARLFKNLPESACKKALLHPGAEASSPSPRARQTADSVGYHILNV